MTHASKTEIFIAHMNYGIFPSTISKFINIHWLRHLKYIFNDQWGAMHNQINYFLSLPLRPFTNGLLSPICLELVIFATFINYLHVYVWDILSLNIQYEKMQKSLNWLD